MFAIFILMPAQCLQSGYILTMNLFMKTLAIKHQKTCRCPWTGTAIGKKNMYSFQWFVGLVFVCLIMDIFLITGAIPR